MPALETIVARADAPGTGGALAVPATGDSFTIRSMPTGMKSSLIAAGIRGAAAGRINVRGALMHDSVVGVEVNLATAASLALVSGVKMAELPALSTYEVFATGSATAGQITSGFLWWYYPDLGGSNARLISVDELRARALETVCVPVTLSVPTAGQWGPDVSLTSTADILKGTDDYAFVGATGPANGTIVSLRGTDTGSLRVGVPVVEPMGTSGMQWLLGVADAMGLPLIPVISAANRGSTFASAVTHTTVSSARASIVLVRLA